jgi:DNA polymerase V
MPAVTPYFLHKIPAGFPSPASDYIEDGLDLNVYLVKHKAASYFFAVEGESMIGSGIYPGDRVLVDRSITPLHGHVVVAVINGEYTLKRLYRMDGLVELLPDNPLFSPIKITDETDLVIWGVVAAVVRKYKV